MNCKSTPSCRSIPLERMRSESGLTNPYIYRISELYAARSLEDVSCHHRLNFSALIYITEGEGQHYIDHQLHMIKAGTLLTLGKNQIHAFAKSRTVDGFVVPFNCTFLAENKQDPYFDSIIAALVQVNCIHNIGEDIDALFKVMVSEFYSDSEFRAEIIRSLLRTILLKSIVPVYKARAQQAKNLGASDFYRLKNHIDEHFNLRPSVAEIALALGKSVKQLDKLSKDNAGISVKELLDERVLIEAKRQLAFSQYTISDIATELGFNEATNMTKFFKRHTGINPKDFRQLCRMGLRNT
ncbi:helix-turn-helix transcriptional regulator [Vibrio sp. 404]|uniref:Helix-turn-helix transcriptional regulator n=1 Tax=Vibrio marinisediminis TaxID=2758441 RepID=A0A7W2FN07_9VIBR|nr:AraC family transcriptional regulator [Vibrio marinisediminis]MBA5761096.1 helix-turn-helix transcriptional regulator [Vibrio marinisediminis]